MSAPWEPSFVAVSAILGEPLEDVVAALGDASVERAAEILRGLRSPTKSVRARALARVVSEVALAIDRARLA